MKKCTPLVLFAAFLLSLLAAPAQAQIAPEDCYIARINYELIHAGDWRAVTISFEGTSGDATLVVTHNPGYYVMAVQYYYNDSQGNLMPAFPYLNKNPEVLDYQSAVITDPIMFVDATGCAVPGYVPPTTTTTEEPTTSTDPTTPPTTPTPSLPDGIIICDEGEHVVQDPDRTLRCEADVAATTAAKPVTITPSFTG